MECCSWCRYILPHTVCAVWWVYVRCRGGVPRRCVFTSMFYGTHTHELTHSLTHELTNSFTRSRVQSLSNYYASYVCVFFVCVLFHCALSVSISFLLKHTHIYAHMCIVCYIRVHVCVYVCVCVEAQQVCVYIHECVHSTVYIIFIHIHTPPPPPPHPWIISGCVMYIYHYSLYV